MLSILMKILYFPSLFDLRNIMDLDVSYNNIHEISRDICKLMYVRLSLNLYKHYYGCLFVSVLIANSLSISISCCCRNLQKLNIEGNQLTGLPATTLSLPIAHIILGNNLMHPLLWKENTRNEPQVSYSHGMGGIII